MNVNTKEVVGDMKLTILLCSVSEGHQTVLYLGYSGQGHEVNEPPLSSVSGVLRGSVFGGGVVRDMIGWSSSSLCICS
jgi:hypothetical protein